MNATKTRRRRPGWLPGRDADRTDMVVLRGGDRVDRIPRDQRIDGPAGVDSDAGTIPWDAVDGFLSWYEPAQRWIFTPMD